MSVEVSTKCASCLKEFDVSVIRNAEQKGGMMTEYIPEYFEIDDPTCPHCNMRMPHLDRAMILSYVKKTYESCLE